MNAETKMFACVKYSPQVCTICELSRFSSPQFEKEKTTHGRLLFRAGTGYSLELVEGLIKDAERTEVLCGNFLQKLFS